MRVPQCGRQEDHPDPNEERHAELRVRAAEPQELGRVRPREEWAPLVGVRKSWLITL